MISNKAQMFFFKEDDASGRMLVRRLIGFEEVECPH